MPARLKRILCIDDEEDILAIVRMCLEMLPGVDVECCGEGGKAAIARAQAFRPDIVLLDVMMPGMDGPSTMRAMRADPKLKDVPVVLMTARVRRHEVDEYLALGATGVIPKPFDPMTLGAEIAAIWESHLAAKTQAAEPNHPG